MSNAFDRFMDALLRDYFYQKWDSTSKGKGGLWGKKEEFNENSIVNSQKDYRLLSV